MLIGPPPRTRLLTSAQYANMISDVFGSDIKPGSPVPPMNRTEGLLEVGAASVGVTAGQVLQLQRSAVTVATQVVDNGNIEARTAAHRNALVPCRAKDEKAADDACTERFVRSVGRYLFRRPLSPEKVTELVSAAHVAASNNRDFYMGLSGVLEGMLIDPLVLLVADTTEPDPHHLGQRRLDPYAFASRLSLFLWNSVPDDELLKAAETGEIYSSKGRAKIISTMLASPKLESGVRAFFEDMFAFDDFDTLSKDPTVYPAISGTVLKDAREQTLRTIYDQLIKRNGDYRDLFTTRETFMSPALASVYKVQSSPGWQPYTFPPDSPRVGILTHVSYLTVHSHPARSSPTRRGKALRELLLCQKVPSPPPNVDFSLVENPPPNIRTQRERVNLHLKNPVCAGCHKITDPMGLALENFDGGGQFRTAEHGAAIDTSGVLDGVAFNDAAGLGQALHNHPSLPTCLTKRLFAYATGGLLEPADGTALEMLDQAFAGSGYRFKSLMQAVAMSDAFTIVRSPERESALVNSDNGPTLAK